MPRCTYGKTIACVKDKEEEGRQRNKESNMMIQSTKFVFYLIKKLVTIFILKQ